MAPLIPLRLASSDTNLEEPPSSSTSAATTSSPPIPTKSKARQRRPGPVTNLLIFPYTKGEWFKVMEEIKRLYMKRQYRQCSGRCTQILDNIKDPYRVHPLHSIYLSFYAASSLELTARSLHLNSSSKLPLLQQSLSYYQNAEASMEYADPTTIPTALRHSSSISSSIRSSMDSVFSRSSTYSAASSMPSPTSSLCESGSDNGQTQNSSSSSTTSYEDQLSPAPLRIRKKVTFYPKLPETDLATLVEDTNLLNAFPTPPTSTLPASSSELQESSGTIASYLLSRSVDRYRTHLSVLHTQLAYHIGSLNAQIHALQTCRKARRSNLPNLFTTDFRGGEMDGVDKEEIRSVELKARIERLKANGWRRERFNGERYQLLAEKANAELE